MIDFENATYLKLKPVQNTDYYDMLEPMLIDGESIVQSFRGVRDGIVFTDRRIFTINIQGVIGKKKDFTSLPYNKIQAFSVETAGFMDTDSELTLWFSGMGMIKFEFVARANIKGICRIVSEYML